MQKRWKMKISNFKNLFTKDKKVDQDALMNDIFSLVVQVEEKHKKVEAKYEQLQDSVSATIKNERILHALVQVSNILMKSDVEPSNFQTAFDILFDVLDIDKIIIGKIDDDDIIKKRWEWVKSGEEMTDDGMVISSKSTPELFQTVSSGVPYIFNDIDESVYVQKFVEKFNIKGACIFPVFVDNEVWGAIGYLSYKRKIVWATDDINIKGLLSSLFSTYLQNRTLIAKLKKVTDNGTE